MPRGYPTYGPVFGRRVYRGTDLAIASPSVPAHSIASQHRPPVPLMALVRCLFGSSKTKNRSGLQLFCDYGLFRSAKVRISARKRSKSAVKRPVFAFRELEGVRNRKKVAKKSDFLFLQGADRSNGADSAKDARGRGDGDEASFREKDKRLIAFLPVSSVAFSDSNPWFKDYGPFADVGRFWAFSFDSGSCCGFLLLGEQCMLCRIACKK